MSEEIIGITLVIMDHWVFKTVAGTSLTTLIGWALISIRNTSKKINNAPTHDELDCIKKEAFKYTDDRILDHEKVHKSIESNFQDMKADNVRIESKVDKILFLLAKR